MSNLPRLQAALRAADVPAHFVSNIANVQWLTGFTGSSGFVLVTPDDARFLTDSRYTIQAGEQVRDMPVRSYAAPVTFQEFFRGCLAELGVTRLAFEQSCSYATFKTWREEQPQVEWIEVDDLLKPLRMIKAPEEVAKIREACRLADSTMAHVQRMLQPGVSEYDIGLDIEFFIRRNMAAVGFEPIVASGPNSARPHARPTERLLQDGDFLTIDLGATLDGYNSDITRTFVIGRASERHREVYGQVLEAQVASIDALRPGATGIEVDSVARRILDEKGLAQYFGHGLGHGLGRVVHDYGGLSQSSKDVIEAGQVWTIEPGVYIEGFGGVRIEDDVHVTPDGPEVLTHFPKGLIELG